jgi:hypothetical protein
MGAEVKKLLIVSPHFPPINSPDMQRVRMSLPYYRKFGWEPIVLTVHPHLVDGVTEPGLSRTVPDNVRIIRCGALPLKWAKRAGVGNIALRSWWQMLRAGNRLLREEKIDLVFFSTTQFICFLLGPIWRRRFKVPYVLDVQDPWRTDYYERPGARSAPGGWKYQSVRLQANLLEGVCFRNAAAVMSVSPSYLDDLRARYPGFALKPTAVLRFGASPSDLELARDLPAFEYAFPTHDGDRHFLYTGASGPVMPHALLVLFTALRTYREKCPERGRRLKFHFIGTSYVPPGQGKNSVMPIADQCGVADQVREVPHRIGYLDTLQLQNRADVLMLLGSSDLAYSPSKIYLYFLTDRPILGIVFRDSVMERLLDELACGYVVRFRERDPKEEAYARLHRFFDYTLDGFPAQALPERNREHFNAHYLAEELTRQQSLLFERALGT